MIIQNFIQMAKEQNITGIEKLEEEFNKSNSVFKFLMAEYNS